MNKRLKIAVCAVLILLALGVTLYPLISNMAGEKYRSLVETKYNKAVEKLNTLELMPDIFCRHSLAIAWHHLHCPRIENGAGDNHTDFADTSPCNWYFAQIEREKEGNKHRNKQDKHGAKYSQCASRIPDHAREGSKHSGFIGRYNTDPRTGRGNEKCKKREIT